MCDYETFYPSTMKAHEERHQPDLPTSCEQCGETFINKRCVTALFYEILNMFNFVITCVLCSLRVASPVSFVIYLFDKRGRYVHTHAVCTDSTKEKHVLAVHTRKTPSRRVEPKETCPRCKLSVRRSNMSEHMLRHERNDSVVFNCSQCDFTTHDKYALNGKCYL